ncbi:MAG: hypothetical protein ACK6D3_15325 [Planctomycetaceae bacterium]|jgi:hypothetical protein
MSFPSAPPDSADEPLESTPFGRFWQRWYWPTVSLAALLAFELTASPALSAVLLCCHFGVEDWLTGLWLWRTDPDRGRGRACGWFSFARAVTRTLLAAFLLMMLLVVITAQFARNQPRGPGNMPAGFWGIALLMMGGLPLATLLSLIACLSARRHAVKVWLDPGLHISRKTRQWPVSILGVHNLADMPYLLMISVLLMTVLTPMIIAIASLLPQKGPRPGFDIAIVGAILAVSLTCLWLLLRWTNQARARLPFECWGSDTFRPTVFPLAPGLLANSWDDADDTDFDSAPLDEDD